METQFITDIKGNKKKAVISIEHYNHFMELLEEEEDCKLYDEAKKDSKEQTFTFIEVANDLGYEV